MRIYPNEVRYIPNVKRKTKDIHKKIEQNSSHVVKKKEEIEPPIVVLDKNNKPEIKRKEVIKPKVVQETSKKVLTPDVISKVINKVRRNGIMKRAVKFGIIGLGQGGARLAGEFEKLGYAALAINTSEQDLGESPCKNKLAIGTGGAGRDLRVGASAVNEHRASIMNAYQTSFPNIDHALICAGSSGGTGGGGLKEIIDTLIDYKKPVGVVTTLPLDSEDTRSKKNTLIVINQLVKLSMEKKISPFIIVDNNKIEKKYPGLSTLVFWNKANEDVVKCFDLFNMLSARSSAYTSFDPADYIKVLMSGGCMIFGNLTIEGNIEDNIVADAISKNIDNGLLAEGFNLVEATHAACLMVANPEQLKIVPRAAEENAMKVLMRLLGSGTIFKGVYSLNAATAFETFFMISGLGLPTQRMKKLIKSSREEVAHLEKKVTQRTVDDIMRELNMEEENNQ